MLKVCVVLSWHGIAKSSHFLSVDSLISMKPEKMNFAHDITEAEPIVRFFDRADEIMLWRADAMKLCLKQRGIAP
ncbi:uncharacterized protein EAF01_002448 [Botrytis porri]|uniref:uncharacterized protein n=1 Tax=Botrytis porri TaxID=87229 RepID=UPI0018FFF102|nr:uncharacterized protein EAF01_002448 [Botrytis porri]KAF7910939.1 hypothetical protein EAF01_002448 [Botrytis porri]